MNVISMGLFVILLPNLVWAEVMTPELVLKTVVADNPEIASLRSRIKAEEAIVSSKYSLANPRLGLMVESNTSQEAREMGEMQSWTFSQEIMFPTKYLSMANMQRYRVAAIKEEFLDKMLEIRQRALSLFYGYASATRTAGLLEAQRETLREIARIVETRRATGAVPQQDEMKIHVEQTRIESEILLQSEELVGMRAMLNAVLNRTPESDLTISSEELKPPKIMKTLSELKGLIPQKSKMIGAERAWLKEAETNRSLARQSYLPDFMLSYRKPFGSNAPANSYVLGVELTLPLWFFSKQSSEVSAANARLSEAEKRLELTHRSVEAEAKSLTAKVETLTKYLKIFETALIPQSFSALNSSRAAYSAGRVGFQELLDAERSLYAVRIDYYKNLARFVEALTALERTIGTPVSDLPVPGDEQ